MDKPSDEWKLRPIDYELIFDTEINPVEMALHVLNIPRVTQDAKGKTYNNARIMFWAIREFGVLGEEAFRGLVAEKWAENRVSGCPDEPAKAFNKALYRLVDAIRAEKRRR